MAETTSTEPTEEVIETQINDLDPRFIKQLESAEKSIDKNPGYTDSQYKQPGKNADENPYPALFPPGIPHLRRRGYKGILHRRGIG